MGGSCCLCKVGHPGRRRVMKQGMGSEVGIIIRGLIILSRAMAFMGTGEGGGEEVVMGRRGAS